MLDCGLSGDVGSATKVGGAGGVIEGIDSDAPDEYWQHTKDAFASPPFETPLQWPPFVSL